MVAIVTPMKEGRIDEQALRRLVDRQITAGTDGIVPCGTTGESATLTHEEHDLVVNVTVDQVKGRVKVLAGAGSNATHEAIRLTKSAQQSGANGVLHITPYYNKPTQEGLYQHFKAISESTDLPVILYNVPGRTAVNLLPETVARLAEFKNMVGIKEACGDFGQIKKLISICPRNFLVLSGEDAQTLDLYKMGARGAISVTANVVPEDCAKEWRAFKDGDVGEAGLLHEKLMPLHDAMFLETNPIPVKAALALMGLIEEEYRLPLVKMGDENRKKLMESLRAYGLI